MMKIDVRGARMHVHAEFTAQGSVLAQTVESASRGVTYRLEVEGASRPISMALTSAREIPLATASSCCDQLRARREDARVLRMDTFMSLPT